MHMAAGMMNCVEAFGNAEGEEELQQKGAWGHEKRHSSKGLGPL